LAKGKAAQRGDHGRRVSPNRRKINHLSAGRVLAKDRKQVKAGEAIGLTGTSGNASSGAPHLHFEIRTTSNPNPGLGDVGRVDPATVLGYHYLRSE
jgi:murein DD-endopeptidase MepM/ murein hydrolase activator NlpD